MNRAIYAASLDPITRGHLNVIERATKLFDELIVGIGVNPDKKYTFSLEERESLARQVLQNYGTRVIVKSFPGLLSDFAYENGISTVIRGARNSADFDMEHLLNDINQSFKLGIETIVYFSDQKLSHISSSAAKELAKNQAGNLLEYVPLIVKRALERRICGQYFVGITGEIGCGKSYIAKALCAKADSALPIYNIDLDSIGHEVLETATEQVYVNTRHEIAQRLGLDILKENGMIDVQRLGAVIFSSPEAMVMFNRLMRKPMSLLLRRKVLNLKGVILINSALIAEESLSTMVNNDVILVQAPRWTQVERLKDRGYSDEVIKQRLSAQTSADNKLKVLSIDKGLHGHGKVILVDNDISNGRPNTTIDEIYNRMLREIVTYGIG
jgi:pantetheine-phosphate adenylyltransferase/dephospho-CoA kinase